MNFFKKKIDFFLKNPKQTHPGLSNQRWKIVSEASKIDKQNQLITLLLIRKFQLQHKLYTIYQSFVGES
jgi:hypothetical protein